MLNQISKNLKGRRTNNSSVANCGYRVGAMSATKARCRPRRFCQGAITSKSTYRSLHPTNEAASRFCFDVIGNYSQMRRTKVTVAESVTALQQQDEHHVPRPTWSVQDLELASTHSSITQKELERLARLVLLDVSPNSSNCDDRTLDSLKQDLGNMLHMILHVEGHDYQESKGSDIVCTRVNNDDGTDPTVSAAIHDTVRGVKEIPLRKEIEKDPLQAQDDANARVTSGENLHTKMVRRGGGHKYFAIKTTQTQGT